MNQIWQDIWKWAKLVTPFLKCYVQLLAKSVHNLTRITVMGWRGLKRSGYDRKWDQRRQNETDARNIHLFRVY